MIVDAARHWDALQTSGMLTEWFRKQRWPMATKVKPEKVIRLLNDAGVRFVVMGTHGLVGYRSESRATQDVDVLVRKTDHAKAVAAIKKGFPKLTVTDYPVVTRFTEPTTGKVVIDLMKPTDGLLRVALRNAVSVGNTYLIPDLEMALAAKFAAMVSPNRDPAKKLVDAGDFVDVVRHNRRDLDVQKLRDLADKVYPDGGAEVIQLIEDIDAGRTIRF